MNSLHNRKRARDTGSQLLLPDRQKHRRLNHDTLDDDQRSEQDEGQAYLTHDDYTVGWICALPLEMAAARAMLDAVHPLLAKSPNDSNTYVLGSIGPHNIAIACLPSGRYGTNNAATVASHMFRTFPHARLRLMVGVSGGVPTKKRNIRLGDVVVGSSVIQYDMGKVIRDGIFERTGRTYYPKNSLLTAVSALRAQHECAPSTIPLTLSDMLRKNPSMIEYTRQETLQDLLFDSIYDHIDSIYGCELCDKSRLVDRPIRTSKDPQIHYGPIASGNQVIKDGKSRDKMAEELDVLCFEMEAAGLMESFSCLVIRGVSDYSDSHKDKQWQRYAAATAAAYAKEILLIMPPAETQRETGWVSAVPRELSIQDRRKALLDSLRFIQIESRRSDIKAAYSKTCQWLFAHPEYIKWLDVERFHEHRGILWIRGKPGAGKSTLMKYAYTHAIKKATRAETIISFFFNARGEDLEKSTTGMYRSLLHQLLRKLPKLQGVLDTLEHTTDESNSSTWDLETLHDLLSTAINKLGPRRLTCFIDALDECDEHQVRAMIAYFEDLARSSMETRTGPRLYICFSSRHYPSLHIQYGQRLILENQSGHGQDLEYYVHNNLSAGTGPLVDEVRAEILRKADGVFMWTVIVVDILNKEFKDGRIFAVEARLRETPEKLSDLFKDILRRDNKNLDELLLSIQWILYAQRPLKAEEFYYAVVAGIYPRPESLAEWNPNYISQKSIRTFVMSSSKGLAEITRSENQTVQFIHESVRDFLLKDRGLQELWPDLGEDFQSLSHDRLKQCCYSYIKVNQSPYLIPAELPKASSRTAERLRKSVSIKFPFLQYATQNVFYHADIAAAGTLQNTFLEEFDLRSWIHLNNLFEYQIRRYTVDASFCYIFADKNRPRLIQTIRRRHPWTLIPGERYRYPLFAAFANRNLDAVKALLQQETVSLEDEAITQLGHQRKFVVPKGQNPLDWALNHDHIVLARALIASGSCHQGLLNSALPQTARDGLCEAVKLLLEQGADPSALEIDGQPMNCWLVEYGSLEVIRIFLDHRANSATTDYEDQTILSLASRQGRLQVVELMLARGAGITTADVRGQTALSLAAEHGNLEVIDLFLQRGADVNFADKEGQTPLFLSAKNGHLKISHLLSDYGADFTIADRNKQTVVQWAAYNGDLDIIKLSMKAGASFTLTNSDGQTPLAMAILKGHQHVVEFLVAEGVDLSTQDSSGRTPLLLAAMKNNPKIVDLLIKQRVDFAIADEDGLTSLAWAARNGGLQIISMLLEEGADFTVADKEGLTPLTWAARSLSFRIFDILLEKGADFTIADKNGLTVLAWAARQGGLSMVYVLLKEGADFTVADNEGLTPLAWAARKFRLDIIEMLLKKGADFTVADNEGLTPLDWAKRKGYGGYMDILIKKYANLNPTQT